MSLVSSENTTTATVGETLPGFSAFVRQRVKDYSELCRLRIAVMTMVSVAVGFTLASPIVFNAGVLLVALVGVVFLVAASSIFNQCLEQHTDRLMKRTVSRPIASGRLPLSEAIPVASVLTGVGFAMLWHYVNPMTAFATLATLVTYVCGYTVLKTHTSLCTTIGAIPGAMPPVIGWLAAGGSLGIEAFSLFAVFFVWQFPHFLAIGWIHRKDYEKAGLKMLPSFKDNGLLTGVFAVTYAAVFVPISALPAYVNVAGDFYLLVALGLSICYLFHSLVFLWKRTDANARRLLYVSLCCLPLLLAALVIDFLRLTAFG